MEDNHFLPYMFNDEGVHAFGIFDGHRRCSLLFGAAAAEFSCPALPGFLQTHCSIGRPPSDALKKSFTNTDTFFKEELDKSRKTRGVSKKDWHPSCSALVVQIEHVARLLEERELVTGAGGKVRWLVTHYIGDDDLKPAVTTKPEITETPLARDDEHLVIMNPSLVMARWTMGNTVWGRGCEYHKRHCQRCVPRDVQLKLQNMTVRIISRSLLSSSGLSRLQREYSRISPATSLQIKIQSSAWSQ
ncbi:hypothetical protein MLD38_015912 [Melastoma candidum]|uniref:Uncharacterized protein n=1 Tax=Melastoma candidum TaxID=119954 RepID=A0ACB9RHA9_9MYRT|nr:hypothetical protein MLD38_015912 [Melastoma candidum]